MSNYNRVGAAIARRNAEAVQQDTNWRLGRVEARLKKIREITDDYKEAEDARGLYDIITDVRKALEGQ